MPDWSYLTVGQSALFRISPSAAREVVLGMLGTTSRLPFGGNIIDFMGHMRVKGAESKFGSPRFRVSGPVCMGTCIDPDLKALNAFERFGFGAMLIGPFSNDPSSPNTISSPVTRDDVAHSLTAPNEGSTLTLEQAAGRLRSRRVSEVCVFLRPAVGDPESIGQQLASLGDLVDAVVVPLELANRVAVQSEGVHVLAHVRAEDLDESADLTRSLSDQTEIGFFVDGAILHDECHKLGAQLLDGTHRTVLKLRSLVGDQPFILAQGGIHEPQDAISLVDVGANMVTIDSGMVFYGPGLAKRINESIEFLREEENNVEEEPAKRAPEAAPPSAKASWFWIMAMGLAMVFGGILATAIALTRVVLPYDEAMIGISRIELAAINDRLLDFMKHDRITLAGTMFSVGGLYVSLSWFAVRRGAHWASFAVFLSAFTGFVSFFLFLGFGYFDPFHAFVTAVLFQFLLLAVFSDDPNQKRHCYPDLRNDRAWRRALWGQLLFIIHGATLIVAGLVICTVGITSVFVTEDMEFMCTTPEKLMSANANLIPMVAHDRATFGGMLISCGIAVALTALWGVRRGAIWIWWMMLVCGVTPYVMTIWVHHAVGYIDVKHLAPAYGGVAALLLGSWLWRAYLADRSDLLAGAKRKKPASRRAFSQVSSVEIRNET